MRSYSVWYRGEVILTTMRQLGSEFEGMYKGYLIIQSVYAPLFRLIRYLNLPTDLLKRRTMVLPTPLTIYFDAIESRWEQRIQSFWFSLLQYYFAHKSFAYFQLHCLMPSLDPTPFWAGLNCCIASQLLGVAVIFERHGYTRKRRAVLWG